MTSVPPARYPLASVVDSLPGREDNPRVFATPVMSFHPKLDVLNSGLSEICVAAQLAELSGQKPIWIPYPYDLGFKTGANKIASPVTVQFENEYVNILSDSRVGSNPISAVKGFKASDIKDFSLKMRATFQQSLAGFKEQINEVKIGHPLFHMKNQARIKDVEQQFAASFAHIEQSLHDVLPHASLSDQLAYFNGAMVRALLGVDMDIRPIDKILAEDTGLLDTMLEHYATVEQAVGPGIKIVGKNGERHAVHARGDNDFTVNDTAYDAQQIGHAFKTRQATITGETFFAVMNALGHGMTVGGHVTQPYYGALFAKAEQISDIWQKPFDLKYVLFDLNVAQDGLNLCETAASLRVMDKVASRNFLVNGAFEPARHVADHLGFIGGAGVVPDEFAALAPATDQPCALAKKTAQLATVQGQLDRLDAQDISGDDIALLAKNHRCKKTDAGYVQKTLENGKADLQAYVASLQNDVRHERVFLGGTVDGVYHDGVVHRNRRYPALVNMLVNARDVTLPPLVATDANVTQYCLGTIVAADPATPAPVAYESPNALFDDLLSERRLPFNLLSLGRKNDGPRPDGMA